LSIDGEPNGGEQKRTGIQSNWRKRGVNRRGGKKVGGVVYPPRFLDASKKSYGARNRLPVRACLS